MAIEPAREARTYEAVTLIAKSDDFKELQVQAMMRKQFGIMGRVEGMARASQRNEYAENELLAGASSPRVLFDQALRDYAAAEGSHRQARLIEAVIRTSRLISDDSTRLQRFERQVLESITQRYRHFAASLPADPLLTYRDARNLLQLLFF